MKLAVLYPAGMVRQIRHRKDLRQVLPSVVLREVAGEHFDNCPWADCNLDLTNNLAHIVAVSVEFVGEDFAFPGSLIVDVQFVHTLKQTDRPSRVLSLGCSVREG